MQPAFHLMKGRHRFDRLKRFVDSRTPRTLWPSGQGVGLRSRWGLPAWVRIPQVSLAAESSPASIGVGLFWSCGPSCDCAWAAATRLPARAHAPIPWHQHALLRNHSAPSSSTRSALHAAVLLMRETQVRPLETFHAFAYTKDTLAEWPRRRPAKPMGSPRVGSNPTGAACCHIHTGI